MGAATGAGGSGGTPDAGDDTQLDNVLAAARGVLDGVEKDERLGAAMQLARRAAEQTAAAEQSRLLEVRRYLGEIKRLRDSLLVRDAVVVCELLVPALDQVYPRFPTPTRRP